MSSQTDKVECGDLVKCLVTGFSGIVTTVIEWQHNCDRARIQPRDLGESGYIRATETIDVTQLQILEKAAVVLPVIMADPVFKFGDLVKDTETPFNGKVIGIARSLNGCTRLVVQPNKLKEDGQPVESVLYPPSQLELVTEEKTPQKRSSTGGSMREPLDRFEAALGR